MQVTFLSEGGSDRMLLAVPTKTQLLALLRYLLDEDEFLSPHGIRSLSKVHKVSPVRVSLRILYEVLKKVSVDVNMDRQLYCF